MLTISVDVKTNIQSLANFSGSQLLKSEGSINGNVYDQFRCLSRSELSDFWELGVIWGAGHFENLIIDSRTFEEKLQKVSNEFGTALSKMKNWEHSEGGWVS